MSCQSVLASVCVCVCVCQLLVSSCFLASVLFFYVLREISILLLLALLYFYTRDISELRPSSSTCARGVGHAGPHSLFTHTSVVGRRASHAAHAGGAGPGGPRPSTVSGAHGSQHSAQINKFKYSFTPPSEPLSRVTGHMRLHSSVSLQCTVRAHSAQLTAPQCQSPSCRWGSPRRAAGQP